MMIHHTGIIIDNIEKNINIYKRLGYTQMSEIIIDGIQYVKIVFLKSEDSTQTIELIESLGDISSINKFKTGYHHICYDVSDTPDFVNYFKTLKVGKIFTKPMVATAISNREVVFALLNNGSFVEFILSR